MALNLTTLRNRATKFAKEFATARYEMGEAQSFIIGLCEIFGLNHRRAVQFESRVKKLNGKRGRIDGFFPSLLLIEMKSAGEDLDAAYQQATEYFHGLNDDEMPRCVLVSDFQNLHLYLLDSHASPLKIKLEELPQYLEHFLFLTGYEKKAIERQEKINKLAAEKMADLHDAVKRTGYSGKDLETYLVRLLFCLFAEDTGLFGEKGAFLDYLQQQTKSDGSDLHGALIALFDTLNTDNAKRLKNLPEHLKKFPYVNGALFDGSLAFCQFDETSRQILIDCALLDWSEISPAIFGSLFQAIMHFDDEAANAKTKKRREFGAHYTSEENILKTINPLFMDDLRAEFVKCSKAKLPAFHQKLATLNFFDPACGCGNFLIIAYRELRLLELDVIKAQYGNKQIGQIDVDTLILCNVHQFHGIDIDESAAQIATLALWLVDHQMNLRVQELGNYYNRIPLKKKANIVCANALQIDWQSVIKPKDCSFIMGNPPFIGSRIMNEAQKIDAANVIGHLNNNGLLDYVTNWHVKATAFIKNNPDISVGFVSTNSICQGEQVGTLWSYLFSQGVKIHFAHRTFRWNNEGRGIAAVHCVIIGFGLKEPSSYRLFDYEDIKGEPIEIKAAQINSYLVDAPNVIITNREQPISNIPAMRFGSMPRDGGFLIFTIEEKEVFLAKCPAAEKWLKPYIGAHEFLNGEMRWVLWLVDISPAELNKMPDILERVKQVKAFRLASKAESTRKFAETPAIFCQLAQPTTDYLLFPRHSSEQRKFVPIGFFTPDNIVADSCLCVPNATLYHFGVLTSTMHNAWIRAVCGRIKSDYRYSQSIVYNNFPFPTPNAKQIKTIEEKAQAVLDACAIHETSTLADLYNPLTMPANLVKAHNELDKAVDSAYNYKNAKDDAARVAFLFEKYQELVAPLVETEKPKKSKVKK